MNLSDRDIIFILKIKGWNSSKVSGLSHTSELLKLLQPNLMWWLLLWIGVFCQRFGLLPSRSRSQWLFKSSRVFFLPYPRNCWVFYHSFCLPQWGAADAEIKVPSGENTEFKRSPFKAWSRSVYSHTCYAYCQGFLPGLFLPFWSIHLHFSQNLSSFLLYWLWLTRGSCVGPQSKIGHPAGCWFPCWVPAEYKYAPKTWRVV